MYMVRFSYDIQKCIGGEIRLKLEISSVHEMHTMKLRFHEQTEIRYNHVLHGDRAHGANSKPLQSLAKSEKTRERHSTKCREITKTNEI